MAKPHGEGFLLEIGAHAWQQKRTQGWGPECVPDTCWQVAVCAAQERRGGEGRGQVCGGSGQAWATLGRAVSQRVLEAAGPAPCTGTSTHLQVRCTFREDPWVSLEKKSLISPSTGSVTDKPVLNVGITCAQTPLPCPPSQAADLAPCPMPCSALLWETGSRPVTSTFQPHPVLTGGPGGPGGPGRPGNPEGPCRAGAELRAAPGCLIPATAHIRAGGGAGAVVTHWGAT